jgi:beta-lactamase regulating signal transducer with metallopeptidase domain
MWDVFPSDLLWRNALAAIPLALLVAVVCRLLPNRPAVRHSLWLTVLLWLVASPFLPSLELGPQLATEETTPASFGIASPSTSDLSQPPQIGTADSSRRHGHGITQHASRLADPAPHPTIADNDSVITQDDAESPRGLSRSPDELQPIHEASRSGPPPLRTLAQAAGSGGKLTEAIESDKPRASVEAVQTPSGLHTIVRGPPRNCEQSGTAGPSRSHAHAADVDRERHLSAAGCLDAAAPHVGDPSRLTPGKAGTAGGETTAAAPPGEPPPASASKPQETPSRRHPSEWLVWLGALVRIRDAVGHLPPIPSQIWVLGIGLVLLVKTAGLIRAWRSLRRAHCASRGVTALVKDVARDLGLQRVPQTLMLDKPVSPMVWLGHRARLVLPSGLWSQLDAVGRRAVVCHELAHLRRRDHWVCWAQAVIGCLYWWHPLIWWARRRLHAEAELACDAWVTWLMPRGRAAYAQALLATQRYIDEQNPLPTAGFGMANGRAALFGRRLKMVMTQTTRPGHSFVTMTLVLALAMVGWIALPAHSDPPESVKAGGRITETAAAGARTTFERHMADVGGTEAERKRATEAIVAYTKAKSKGAKLEKRIDRLEMEIGRLNGMLEHITVLLENRTEGARPPTDARHFFTPIPEVPVMPSPVTTPKGAPLQTIEAPVLAGVHFDQGTLVAPPGIFGLSDAKEKGESVVRRYELPEGKLKALTNLMLRADVPVAVSPSDECIVVHGTAAQHGVFKAFVKLIHEDKKSPPCRGSTTSKEKKVFKQAYTLPEGKLKELTTLMVRSDVPVVVSPSPDAIKVHGTTAQQAVFADFVDLIHPGKEVTQTAAGLFLDRATGLVDKVGKEITKKVKKSKKCEARQKAQESQRHQEAQKRRESRQRQRAAQRGARRAYRDALRQSYGVAGDNAALLEVLKKASELSAHGSPETEADWRRALQDQAQALEEQSRALQQHAEQLEEASIQLQQQAAELEDGAQQVRDHAEEFREAADTIREALHERAARVQDLDADL